MLLRSSEKKGILVLCVILTGFFILPSLFRPTDHSFILLSQVEPADTLLGSRLYQESFKPIELNTADSSTLIRIKGIGPYYASKILKYRNRLGGFYSPDQLKDIQFQYLNIDTLLHFFHASLRYIQKKDMDTMSFKAILKHPYLEYEDVQLIFNAKRKWGNINYSILEEKKILAPYKLKKIKPYFK